MNKTVSYKTQQLTLHDGRKALVSIPSNFRESNIFDKEPDKKQLANLYKRSAWAKRCVAIRANTLSSIPWELVDKSGEVVEKTPLNKLLTEFNPEANWIDAIRATESDLEIYGEAFWVKLGERRPGALKRLNPLTMEVLKEKDGIRGFKQTEKAGGASWEREDVIYFRDYNPTDDLGGLSDTHVAETYIKAEINTENYVSAFFENFALPAVVFEATEGMQKEEAESFLSEFRKKFAGSKKQHKVGVVPGKPHILTPDLEKLAMAEVRQEARQAICAAYGVPPAIAGAWEAANYATADEQRQSLYMETILPRAQYIAGVLNAELVAMFPGNLTFRWKVEDVPALQPDRNAESERIVQEFLANIITVETAGRELGYNEEDLEGEPQEAEGNFGRHLGRWKAKALRALEERGSAQVQYETPAISPAMREAVYASLGAVKSPSGLDRVFERAGMWAGYP